MKKIMIVGGAGYVGTKLSHALFNRGYDVSVVDLFWFGNHLDKNITTHNKDVFALEEKDLKGFDSVVFAAGLSNDPMAEYSPGENFISNSAAPAYLAYIAKQAGVKRMVYASSCSVYGYAVDEFYDETGPTTAEYPYGISKLQGEKSVMSMADDSFSVISLRKGTVSGYSPRMRLDLVVNAMFKSALQTGTITVNNPSIWRPILSIDDCISAYIRAIESGLEISGVFNIASENYTVGEIGEITAETISKTMKRKVEIDIKNVYDVRNYKVDWSSAKAVLGYSPKGNVETIVEQLIENVDNFIDFDNDIYYNIRTFTNSKEQKV